MSWANRTYRKHPVIFVSAMVATAVAVMIPIAISERGSDRDIFSSRTPLSDTKGKRFSGHGTLGVMGPVGTITDYHSDGSRSMHFMLNSSDGRSVEVIFEQGKPRYDDPPSPMIGDRVFIRCQATEYQNQWETFLRYKVIEWRKE